LVLIVIDFWFLIISDQDTKLPVCNRLYGLHYTNCIIFYSKRDWNCFCLFYFTND